MSLVHFDVVVLAVVLVVLYLCCQWLTMTVGWFNGHTEGRQTKLHFKLRYCR